MSEERATYHTKRDEEQNKRTRATGLAIRYAMALGPAERLEAFEELNSTLAAALVNTVDAIHRELERAEGLSLEDVGAILKRPELEAEAKQMAAAEFDLLAPVDPAEARQAYAELKQDTAQAQDLRRIAEAKAHLDAAQVANTAKQRRELLNKAGRSVEAAERKAVGNLAEMWDAYRAERYARENAAASEVLRLDAERGPFAEWVNAWMGRRGGLEPGRCMIVGAAPGGGKTSFASMLAVDAMATGCPVLFWQLELSAEETLEHLLSQRRGAGAWWHERHRERLNVKLPEGWLELLTLPDTTGAGAYEAETICEAMRAQRRRSDRAATAHRCRGLVIVDYAQLLTIRDGGGRGRTPQHEVYTKAASMMAKHAAELGLCLVLLSQVTKSARAQSFEDDKGLDDTALSGADFGRVAHVAFTITHAAKTGKEWKATSALKVQHSADGKSSARLLSMVKNRGAGKLQGNALPGFKMPIWISKELAWHNMDTLKDELEDGAEQSGPAWG